MRCGETTKNSLQWGLARAAVGVGQFPLVPFPEGENRGNSY